MARPRHTTTTRAAHGRERARSEGALTLVLAATLDAIARHRAAGEPLERCVSDVSKTRHLGPRERRAVGDATFAWARLRIAVEAVVDEAIKQEGGVKPTRHERDLAALLLARVGSGLDVDDKARERLPIPLREAVDDAVAAGLPARATLPKWLHDAIAQSHANPDALIKALALPAPFVLAGAPADVDEALSLLGAQAVRSPIAPATGIRLLERSAVRALPSSLRAKLWPMDDGSQVVALAAQIERGVVLDLCAGGGGKTRLLTSRSPAPVSTSTTGSTLVPSLRVVAADVDVERLRRADAACSVVMDGARPAFKPATFDVVLIDAPCSGTGTLRRAPDLAQRLSSDDVAQFTTIQRGLLTSAIELVKPGGLVVYATCSLLRAENDDVVDAILAVRRDLREEQRRHLRPDVDGCDGFFFASLRRVR